MRTMQEIRPLMMGKIISKFDLQNPLCEEQPLWTLVKIFLNANSKYQSF